MMLAALALAAAMVVDPPAASHTAPPAPIAPPIPQIPLNPKPLEPRIDSMRDVQPGGGPIGRCSATIVRAVPEFDEPVTWLSWRVEEDSVALVGRGEGERSAILARLRWRGLNVEWQWARASATTFSKAVDEAGRALPWMTVRASLEGGAQEVLAAPPVRVQRTLRPGPAAIVVIPGGGGRTLALEAAPAPGWTASTEAGGGLRLVCGAGTVRAQVEPGGRLRIELEPPVNAAIAELRRTLTDRQRELRGATDDERMIIDGEIATLRARIAELEAKARVPQVAWPSLPVLRVRSAAGREFAIVEARVEGS